MDELERIVGWRAYWWHALWRAFTDTLSFLGFATQSRLQFSATAISYFLALLFVLFLAGKPQMVEELRWGIAVVGAVFAIFLPIYLVNLIAAPVRMKHDSDDRYGQLVRDHEGEISYLKGIIQGETEHREKQAIHAQLIDEGMALMETVLKSGTDQLEDLRARTESWRQHAGDFLAEHSYGGPADASSFHAAFNKSVANFSYKGAEYSGDRAVLASQIDYATAALQGMSIQQKSYLNYQSVQGMEQA